MTLFKGNLPQKRERERQKKRKKERKKRKKRKNASELDATCYMVTAGNTQVEFPSSVLPVL
jgi:hypothetical protein